MSKVRKSYAKTEKLEIVSQSLEEDQSVKDVALRFGFHRIRFTIGGVNTQKIKKHPFLIKEIRR